MTKVRVFTVGEGSLAGPVELGELELAPGQDLDAVISAFREQRLFFDEKKAAESKKPPQKKVAAK